MDLQCAIQEDIAEDPRVRAEIEFEPDMPTEFPDEGTIDELLGLAGVSLEHSAARGWLESALTAARGTLELRLAATGAIPVYRNRLRQGTTPHSTRLSEPMTG